MLNRLAVTIHFELKIGARQVVVSDLIRGLDEDIKTSRSLDFLVLDSRIRFLPFLHHRQQVLTTQFQQFIYRGLDLKLASSFINSSSAWSSNMSFKIPETVRELEETQGGDDLTLCQILRSIGTALAPSTALDAFPHEILLCILDKLSPWDRVMLALTCKKYAHLIVTKESCLIEASAAEEQHQGPWEHGEAKRELPGPGITYPAPNILRCPYYLCPYHARRVWEWARKVKIGSKKDV